MVVAALAAIIGNVLYLGAIVWLGSWMRSGVVERCREGGAPAGGSGTGPGTSSASVHGGDGCRRTGLRTRHRR